jgi:hypothetical protein
MAELGTGWLTFPWLLPLRTTPLDEEHVALRTFIHGARAANAYQLVERDRWYGSPIDAQGAPREPKASFYRRLHAMLDALGWEHLRRDALVLVVENRALARRIAARARHGDIVPCFSQMLPIDLRLLQIEDAEADALAEWERTVTQRCAAAGFELDRASSDALPDLGAYRVIAVFEPLLLDGLLPAHPGIVSRAQDLERALAALPPPTFRCDADGIEVVRLLGPDREVVAAINGTADDVDAVLQFDGDATLIGRWRAETLRGTGAVQIDLPAWHAQIWEVLR